MVCKECNDTGQITLLTSIVPCKACIGKNLFITIPKGVKMPTRTIDGTELMPFNKQILPPGAQAKYPINFVCEYPEDNPFGLSKEVREEMENWKPTKEQINKMGEDVRDHFIVPQGLATTLMEYLKSGGVIQG